MCTVRPSEDRRDRLIAHVDFAAYCNGLLTALYGFTVGIVGGTGGYDATVRMRCLARLQLWKAVRLSDFLIQSPRRPGRRWGGGLVAS